MKKILLTLIAVSLTACATIFSGTTQNVHLQAVDARDNSVLKDVHCHITDAKGVVHVVPTNPGSTMIPKASGGITPTCTKAGFSQKNFGAGDSFNAVTVVNILFWPGFIVDAMTGAMHKYPSHLTVFMEPSK